MRSPGPPGQRPACYLWRSPGRPSQTGAPLRAQSALGAAAPCASDAPNRVRRATARFARAWRCAGLRRGAQPLRLDTERAARGASPAHGPVPQARPCRQARAPAPLAGPAQDSTRPAGQVSKDTRQEHFSCSRGPKLPAASRRGGRASSRGGGFQIRTGARQLALLRLRYFAAVPTPEPWAQVFDLSF